MSLHVNKTKKKRENIFIFKRNMLILIDISKIAYFSRYFWTEKLI